MGARGKSTATAALAALALTITTTARAKSPLDEIDAEPAVSWTAQASASATSFVGRLSTRNAENEIPLALGASLYGGARATQWLTLVAWGGYGTGAACAGCTNHWIRVGGEAQVRPLRHPRFQPWVGLGAAWDYLRSTRSGTIVGTHTFTGVEIARVTLALDVRIASAMALTPFLDAAVGRYGGATTTGDVPPLPDAPSVHGTYGGGVRLVLGRP